MNTTIIHNINNISMLIQLKQELILTKQKVHELQLWLIDHTSHADFTKIAEDRNYWTVKQQQLEFKISNLEKGLPLLGEEMPKQITELNINQKNN